MGEKEKVFSPKPLTNREMSYILIKNYGCGEKFNLDQYNKK